MTIYDSLNELEKKINYKFKDISLLKLALTHKSYAHDKMFKGNDKYNERIEYLGDAVLELIVSDYLYFHDKLLSEGSMTKKRAEIVCGKSLAQIFKKLEGNKYILLGKCEDSKNINDAILADAFESIIGAIYIDSDFITTKGIILNLLEDKIEQVIISKDNIDYKTKLQELLQKNGNIIIKYEVLEEKGPDHDKDFYIKVVVNDEELGRGKGKSKKGAEQNAAKEAYEKLS